jgi:hypothetical protein
MNVPMDVTAELAVPVWPVVVLILGVIFLVLFRGQIRRRIGGVSLPEGTSAIIPYGHATIDEGSDALKEAWRTGGEEAGSFGTRIEIESPVKEALRWDRTATLFWVGHDLMWTIDAVLRGAFGESIARGLQRSLAHIQHLGLGETDMAERLERALEDAENAREMDWTTLQRNILARDLTRIIEAIGGMAGEKEPDFDPDDVKRSGPRKFGR